MLVSLKPGQQHCLNQHAVAVAISYRLKLTVIIGIVRFVHQFPESRLLDILVTVFIPTGENGGFWWERIQDLNQLPYRVMKNVIFSHRFFLNHF